MKIFVALFALSAVALAKPDAQVLLTSGLVLYPDGAITPPETPAVQAATAQHFATKAALGYGYPYYYGAHVIGKREAEADPKANADAQYLAYGYAGVYPYANYGFVNNYAYAPYQFLKKREAEAEPKADSQFLAYPYAGVYGGYAYAGYPYAGYANYG